MKFMISFYHVDGAWDQLSEEDKAEHSTWLRDFAQKLRDEKGAEMVFLNPSATKYVQQDGEGKKGVHDGPLKPEGEARGGYFIIEADSLSEAEKWAKDARFMVGSNEIEEIVDFDVG